MREVILKIEDVLTGRTWEGVIPESLVGGIPASSMLDSIIETYCRAVRDNTHWVSIDLVGQSVAIPVDMFPSLIVTVREEVTHAEDLFRNG